VDKHAGLQEHLAEVVHEHGLDQVVLTDDVEVWLRWIARSLSIIVLAGSVLAFIEFGLPRSHEYLAWEEAASLAALVVACLGLVVAWLSEPFGGGLAMVAGVFVGALGAYQYSLLIALGVSLMFMIPAALFLLAWHRTQSWIAMIVVATLILVLLLGGGAMALAFYDDGHGPTHPESTVAPFPASTIAWIWSGGVTDDGAVVVAKVTEPGQVRLAVGATETLEDARYVRSNLRGPVHRFTLTRLDTNTRYYYAVEIDGTLDATNGGTFTTFGPDVSDLKVAFASCARSGSNAAVFDTIRLLEPDLFLNTGDFFYGDVRENSLDAFADLYDLTLTQSGQAALYRSLPIAYTWDDHDFGPNDATSTSPSRQAALLSYREYVPHYEFGLSGMDAPIAQAFTIGRTRFILTDTRSMRDPQSLEDGPEKSVLGQEQLDWFLAEITTALDSYPVVVWVSSIPWIADAEEGADHWGGYAFEREVIAETIAEAGSEGLVVLAGDAHMIAIDDGFNSSYARGEGFPVMQAAALDRNGSMKGGPYSEGAFPGGGQFGLLTIRDEGQSVFVELKGLDWQGNEIVSLAMSFNGEVGQ
jgi:phosphodiesterase/alkaline phosphatase D-like protein